VVNPGSRFWKADLHVHTPASLDFQDRHATPNNIIFAAINAGLDILGITDHNSAGFITQMIAAARQSSVTVIPGVEITTPEGHILGLFDIGFTSSEIEDLLIKVGIDRTDHGKEEAISRSHAEEVIDLINAAGGIAIAAHANEKGSGLLQQKGQYKIPIVRKPELAALEFTKKEDIERFSTGTVSADYPPKACSQSSDAHALAEIGRRVVFLKMQERCAYGVRQAFLDYQMRVRFPWDFVDSEHPRIVSLKVDQGFFGGQEFTFHENLNCLVGGQGSGKSTVIELLRYCFDDACQFTHIQNDHREKIETLVGLGGTVEVVYLDGDGQTKIIHRQVQPHPTLRSVKDQVGNTVPLKVPPAMFSQGELVEIARTPVAQLDLLDRRVDVSVDNAREEQLLDRLRTMAAQLVARENKLARVTAEIDNPETGHEATRKLHDTLKKQLSEPELRDFPLWESEQQHISKLRTGLADIEREFLSVLGDLDLDVVDLAPPESTPNASTLSALDKTAMKVEKAIDKAREVFVQGLKTIRKNVDATDRRLRPAFEATKAKHNSILKGLGQATTRKASAQFDSLGRRLHEFKTLIAERDKELKRLTQLKDARRASIKELEAARAARSRKRQEVAAECAASLQGTVTIEVAEAGDRSFFAHALRELSRRGHILDVDLNRIATSATPSEVADLILAGDSDGLSRLAKTTPEVSTRFIKACGEKERIDIYGLDAVPIPDLPKISYVVAPGRTKPLKELSTGQKGTVIISMALVESSRPLIVDHPEEPLDTKSVYSQVVNTLRRGKERRQFILTTHNPNIAVGADAELSHILTATADKGSIESQGAVDHAETNRLLLLHLEGGAEALERRVRNYRL
jgi:hypothetical protein